MKILILTFILILSSCIMAEDTFYYRFSHESLEGYLNTNIDFIAYARSEEDFSNYVDILMTEIARLHNLFTAFDPHPNNIYMLNKYGYIEASPEITQLLLASKEAYKLSRGRLNIAIGPVTYVWRVHGQNNPPTIPSLNELYEANQSTNIEHIIIEDDFIRLYDKNMRLDVGAIAKAFAMYLATNKLIEETGIESFLLSVGGDVMAHGAPLAEGRDAWNVGITNPVAPIGASPIVVPIESTSFFASGDYRRFFTVGEENFSHIIDPTTLFPANYFRAVNVIHEDILIAETLTTALFLMPVEEGILLAEELGARVLWIDMEGEIIRTENF